MRYENFARRIASRTLDSLGMTTHPSGLIVLERQVSYPGDCGPQGRAEFSFLLRTYDHSVSVTGVWWDDSVFPLQVSVSTKAHI